MSTELNVEINNLSSSSSDESETLPQFANNEDRSILISHDKEEIETEFTDIPNEIEERNVSNKNDNKILETIVNDERGDVMITETHEENNTVEHSMPDESSINIQGKHDSKLTADEAESNTFKTEVPELDDNLILNNVEESLRVTRKRSPNYILDELDRLRYRLNWHKSFKTKIQPVEAFCSPSSHADDGTKNKAFTSSGRRSKGRPPQSAYSRRPNTSPSKYAKPRYPSPIRPFTSENVFPLRQKLSSKDDLEIDQNCTLESVLHQYTCSKKQFMTAFNNQCSIPPKDSRVVYSDILNSGLHGVEYELQSSKPNLIKIPKRSLKSSKSNEKPVGMLILMNPIVNTFSEVINLKFSFTEDRLEDKGNKQDNIAFSVISGNGSPFHLPLTASAAEEEEEDGKETRMLPGWKGSSPLWIPALTCTCTVGEIGYRSEKISDPQAEIQLEERIRRGSACSELTISPLQSPTQSNSKKFSGEEQTNNRDDNSNSNQWVYMKETKQPILSVLAIPAESLAGGLMKMQEYLQKIQMARVANMKVSGGLSVLSLAVLSGNIDAVSELLKVGADVNQSSCQTHSTALHEAVFAGYYDITIFLLSRGAVTACRDDSGSTVFHIACKRNDVVLTKALLRAPDALKALLLKDNKGRKALDIATGYLQMHIREFMVHKGIHVRARKSVMA
mmetsp:Transcript_41098/g.41982  ORF Transcript_41098/g.41982 Transcript_41098/m.41982 type:complete len:677 (+) Transcript_41098:104-2134(+)|eukprot:CAMPEP_0182436622 /NCGR_PEP_ID=MMETSP1167-20130531/82502_1 /TAXON_ID=2988 /ORGANISM="Mallomonas Sp, Strain CCMP3275" /LENGTH=676 /DNA_ID=CAMNT_0024628967 /DNA_START=60 /DNA_END=2090 /DNA_ORIENTATION=+